MEPGRELTNIQVSKATRDQLKELGTKGQTYDDTIQELIHTYRRAPRFTADLVRTVIENLVADMPELEHELDRVRHYLGMDPGEADPEHKVAKRFAELAVKAMRHGDYGVFIGTNEVGITDWAPEDWE